MCDRAGHLVLDLPTNHLLSASHNNLISFAPPGFDRSAESRAHMHAAALHARAFSHYGRMHTHTDAYRCAYCS